MRSQIPQIRQAAAVMPLYRHRITGGLYLVLERFKTLRRGYQKVTLLQVIFDPSRGDFYALRPFTQEEPWGARRVYTSGVGTHVVYDLLDFEHVDCRWMEPWEINALADVLKEVVTLKDQADMLKYLSWAKDENAPEHFRRNFKMGEATSPLNPVYDPDEDDVKPQIVIDGRKADK